MGCRLHHASEYKIEYKGGWFNWNAAAFRAILRYLEIEVWECFNNDGDDYVDFDLTLDNFNALKRLVAETRESDTYDEPILTKEEAMEQGCNAEEAQYIMTYHNLDDWCKEVEKEYDKSNSYIHFSWF